MTVTQTVKVTDDRRVFFDFIAPKEIPVGETRVIIQFPVKDEARTVPQESVLPPEAVGQMNNEAFRQALRRVQGAWKDNPWTNHLEDINAMRDEWDHRN